MDPVISVEVAQAEASAATAAESAQAAIAASEVAASLANAQAAETVAEVREEVREVVLIAEENEDEITWLKSQLGQTVSLCATMEATLADQSQMLATLQSELQALKPSTLPASETVAETLTEITEVENPSSAVADDLPEVVEQRPEVRRKHRAI